MSAAVDGGSATLRYALETVTVDHRPPSTRYSSSAGTSTARLEQRRARAQVDHIARPHIDVEGDVDRRSMPIGRCDAMHTLDMPSRGQCSSHIVPILHTLDRLDAPRQLAGQTCQSCLIISRIWGRRSARWRPWVLMRARAERIFGVSLPAWQESLERCL